MLGVVMKNDEWGEGYDVELSAGEKEGGVDTVTRPCG
jgi:hypothetical protein